MKDGGTDGSDGKERTNGIDGTVLRDGTGGMDPWQSDPLYTASRYTVPPCMVIECWIGLLERQLPKFDNSVSGNHMCIANTISSLHRYREVAERIIRNEQERHSSVQ